MDKNINILIEYLDFVDVFLKILAAELFKRSDINKYLIDLEPDKKLPYGSIYSLRPIELKTLKTYIKINLTNNFIWPSKFPAKAHILFVKKSNSTLCLCIN